MDIRIYIYMFDVSGYSTDVSKLNKTKLINYGQLPTSNINSPITVKETKK